MRWFNFLSPVSDGKRGTNDGLKLIRTLAILYAVKVANLVNSFSLRLYSSRHNAWTLDMLLACGRGKYPLK